MSHGMRTGFNGEFLAEKNAIATRSSFGIGV